MTNSNTHLTAEQIAQASHDALSATLYASEWSEIDRGAKFAASVIEYTFDKETPLRAIVQHADSRILSIDWITELEPGGVEEKYVGERRYLIALLDRLDEIE